MGKTIAAYWVLVPEVPEVPPLLVPQSPRPEVPVLPLVPELEVPEAPLPEVPMVPELLVPLALLPLMLPSALLELVVEDELSFMPVPVPVELQAARLRAIRPPISTP